MSGAVTVPGDRLAQERYYDSLRARIDSWLRRHAGPRYEAYRQALFLVPDIFALVFRLARDRRVRLLDRLKLWGLVAYILAPVDLNIDFILPLGPLDDLTLAIVVLDSVFAGTPDYILREHWSGNGDAIDVLRGLTGALRRIRRRRAKRPRED